MPPTSNAQNPLAPGIFSTQEYCRKHCGAQPRVKEVCGPWARCDEGFVFAGRFTCWFHQIWQAGKSLYEWRVLIGRPVISMVHFPTSHLDYRRVDQYELEILCLNWYVDISVLDAKLPGASCITGYEHFALMKE